MRRTPKNVGGKCPDTLISSRPMATTHSQYLTMMTDTEDNEEGTNKSATADLTTARSCAAQVALTERQDGLSTIFFHLAGVDKVELGEDALFDAGSAHCAIIRELRGVAGLSVVRDVDGTDGRGFCIAVMCFLRQHQEVRQRVGERVCGPQRRCHRRAVYRVLVVYE